MARAWVKGMDMKELEKAPSVSRIVTKLDISEAPTVLILNIPTCSFVELLPQF